MPREPEWPATRSGRSACLHVCPFLQDGPADGEEVLTKGAACQIDVEAAGVAPVNPPQLPPELPAVRGPDSLPPD